MADRGRAQVSEQLKQTYFLRKLKRHFSMKSAFGETWDNKTSLIPGQQKGKEKYLQAEMI